MFPSEVPRGLVPLGTYVLYIPPAENMILERKIMKVANKKNDK